MAPRSFWKGYLKLSLVTCPVAMLPATTEGEKVRFHTLNRATGHRVESRYVDAVTGKPVAEDNEVKGYQTGADDYVMLEDDELEDVALESTRTIDIDTFVERDSIAWIYQDKPHYLVPNEPVGEEAYSVIRDAMAATGMVGISRLVLYRRERAVMLEPRDSGIVLWTLRYGDEVRDDKDYFAGIRTAKPDTALMGMIKKVIAQRTADWDPGMVKDPIQDQLLQLIRSKKKPKRAKAGTAAVSSAAERPGNVVNLFDALKKSLQSERTSAPRGGPKRS
ncbi:Ku protein [Phreatobacter stygius]|uniref:Non-homologous end joining protein Ku n=1 Tax=Phreatobacter stygius TaxID=1940610 RepID=A0A4D7BF27_9HYPH|nr:Ku protein [Phreatobacter stygius]QCI68498.1 Ku protein [Phreatobacter stygius]